MDEQKFEKLLKDAKYFSIIILVLALISFIVNLLSSNIGGPLSIILLILQILLLLGTAIGCNNRKMYGPICGTIVSILMIVSFSIINIILGIIFLIECMYIFKYMNNTNNGGITIFIIIMIIIAIINGTVRISKIINVSKTSYEQASEFSTILQNAKLKNKRSEEAEDISMSYFELKNEKDYNEITKNDLTKKLEKKGVKASVKETKTDNGEKMFEIQIEESKNVFTLNNKGEVSFIETK